ncbi:hypothetical protein [Jannaschia sp. LMIT008]|uniref:hypothetical protein n=1 Tax=Jannaschia maritima TaxID=3032585 RepID=UPI0028114F96|nr:hypothetical protein [Jannaschia sp. LMIT008]
MIRSLALLAILVSAACQPTIQTTSGADYLSRGPIADPAIRAAAAVEPDLRFPARIGIARIVNGALTQAPPREACASPTSPRHAGMGEWVPLSPLVAGMVETRRDSSLIQTMRTAAARQHLDYLLVYELGARSGPTGDTPFALADVTIVGGLLLPTRTTQATGIGAAAFVDVRNGYPYGTVGATSDLSGLARTWGSDAANARLRARAADAVANDLLPQVDDMLRALHGRAGRSG